MRETETQMLITVFGGRAILIQALNIDTYTAEEQTAILERFCEVVFKRVLLDVSREHIGSVIETFESHRASGRTLDALIEELRRFIPHVDEYVHNEIIRSVDEYRHEARVLVAA